MSTFFFRSFPSSSPSFLLKFHYRSRLYPYHDDDCTVLYQYGQFYPIVVATN